jgi:hypothetical protein
MMQMLSLETVVSVTSEQVSCDLAGETVILNLRDSVYYGLNEVGATIWQLIQEPRTAREVLDAVRREFDVDAERCERDVLALLEKLTERGLVEVRDAAA